MAIGVPAAFARLATGGIYATGGQLYVESRGTVRCDAAVGSTVGERVEVTTLFPAYCATKPLLPLALGHLVDEGGVRLTDEVVAFVDGSAATIADVLAHHASMAEPRAALWRMTPRGRRADLFESPRRSGPAYSEVAAWLTLAPVIETATGMAAVDYVGKAVLEPLDLVDDVIVDPSRARAALDGGRIQVPVAGLPHEQIPLLSERLPQQAEETTIAFGGFASASGLGRLYTSLCSALRGERASGMPTVATLRSLLGCTRPRMFDPVLQRPCRFSGGFMVELDDHGITRMLPDALGHASGIIPAFGLCDPVCGVTIACVLNGVSMASHDLEHVRRTIVDVTLREMTE